MLQTLSKREILLLRVLWTLPISEVLISLIRLILTSLVRFQYDTDSFLEQTQYQQ